MGITVRGLLISPRAEPASTPPRQNFISPNMQFARAVAASAFVGRGRESVGDKDSIFKGGVRVYEREGD